MTITSLTNTNKLPVWRTVKESYRLTLFNLSALIRISWPWLIVLLVAIALLNWGFWPLELAARKTDQAFSSLLFILTSLVPVAVGAAIAVPWHRYILLAEPIGLAPPWKFDGRVIRYAAFAAAIVGGFILPLVAAHEYLVLSITSENGMSTTILVATVCAMIVFWTVLIFAPIRLSLILPAIALGRTDIGLANIWVATRKNFWRLALAGVAATLFSLLLSIGYIYLIDEPTSRIGFALWNSGNEFILMFGGMSYVTFLSLAYRHFYGPFEQQK